MRRSLKDLYYTNGSPYTTDKGSVHSYIDVYDNIFEKYKYFKINILEVGVQTGGSLRLWKDYFPKATIYGYDVDNTKLDESNITERVIYRIQNFNNVDDSDIEKISPTIAIDDASHSITDQLKFVEKVFPHVKKGGVLIVEDIQRIDKDKYKFDKLGYDYDIIDLRSIKNRYDDVFLLFKK